MLLSHMKNRYKELASQEEKVIFGGRLGEYKYYDMVQVIMFALHDVEKQIGGHN